MENEIYLSPFSWRYGSDEMRKVWSEAYKRRVWRQLWVVLAETQAEFGLVTPQQVQDIRSHAEDVNLKRSLEIESETQHDLMAELKAFAEQCPKGGKILHLGATSMDIKDNADVLRVYESLKIILDKVRDLLLILCDKVEQYAYHTTIAFTHLQPAEPTTIGYRFSQYTQDLWMDWKLISRVKRDLKLKGIRGAVGTSASFVDLLGKDSLVRFNQKLAERIGLPFFEVVTQVYPRHQDYLTACAVSGLGASLHRMAFDWRILQSSLIGEWSEPFGKKQVGSSAMPFKRNPINMEKIDSLARMLANFPRLAWDNAANSLLENTLDDSANRRTMLPELFLTVDELVDVAKRMVANIIVNEEYVRRNLETFAPFAATERVLTAVTKAGADRQETHELLRKLSLSAWETIRNGQHNPLVDYVLGSEYLSRYISQDELLHLMDIQEYVGDAPERACQLARVVREDVDRNNE